jgi:translation initiation factor IF-1
MSIASAAPRAPVPRAWRSRCATAKRCHTCAISRNSSACPFRRPTDARRVGSPSRRAAKAVAPGPHPVDPRNGGSSITTARGGIRGITIIPIRQRLRAGSHPFAFCTEMARRDVISLATSRGAPRLQKDHDVAKEELLQFEGLVTEILPDARYRVELDNGHALVAYTAGRMKKNRIKTLAGDRVTVEVSPYDLEKGRLIFRHKDERASTASRPPQRNQFRRR